MCLIATALLADMTSTLNLLGVIVVVAAGLGFVIFVHELGHFLVAKACGVRCDKFFIGFDVGGYKLSRKWGETEYGIGIVPLGGYVKMLGQDDDPAHIAEEMRKCQVGANNPDAVEVTGPNGERYFVDRRSYLAKSVPQRMAIISAGVIMNVIFAFIFAVIAYGIGVPYNPSIVSETVPGSPAWRAGIEPGDEIVQIGDRVNPTFDQLRGGVTLGDLELGVPVVVRRAGTGDEVDMTLTPERSSGLARIGVAPPVSLKLWDPPTADDLPASRATLVEPAAASDGEEKPGFKSGDTIVRVNDEPVTSYRDYAAIAAQQPNEPLRITVARPITTKGKEPESEELTFEVPTQPIRSLGLVMAMGPITAIQSGSLAEAAGLKVGDVIVAVDGQSLNDAASESDWSASSLPDKMREAALAGQTVTLTVERSAGKSGDDTQRVDIAVTPRVPIEVSATLPPQAPMGVPALGIAYRVENRVAAVVPGSPAEESDIEAGDVLLSAKVIFAKPAKGKTPKPTTIMLGEGSPSWPMVFNLLQLTPGSKVELSVEDGGETNETILTPAPVEGLYLAERGFNFKPIERIRRATSFREQIDLGWDTTRESLTMVYRFLQKLGTQIPLTALGGPVTIAQAAGYSAYEGPGKLLIFLTMLSANLAVINFLPIPLLDGGHMVFLA